MMAEHFRQNLDKSDAKNKAEKCEKIHICSQENVKQPYVIGNCCILIFLFGG